MVERDGERKQGDMLFIVIVLILLLYDFLFTPFIFKGQYGTMYLEASGFLFFADYQFSLLLFRHIVQNLL